jgi:hypothetical protein
MAGAVFLSLCLQDIHREKFNISGVFLTFFIALLTDIRGKAVPAQAYCRPIEFLEVEAPRFIDNPQMKVVI